MSKKLLTAFTLAASMATFAPAAMAQAQQETVNLPAFGSVDEVCSTVGNSYVISVPDKEFYRNPDGSYDGTFIFSASCMPGFLEHAFDDSTQYTVFDTNGQDMKNDDLPVFLLNDDFLKDFYFSGSRNGKYTIMEFKNQTAETIQKMEKAGGFALKMK